ncbi:MAG TPA: carboxypeptidase-like regulatory domain-containing protein, partial [Vicinamibacterales bacterium]
MMGPTRQFALAWTALFALSVGASAQTVHGKIVDAAGHPVFGVVVILVDSTSRVAARSLSSESGDYRLSASRAGAYRVRTLRIGFRPVVSEVVILEAGADVARSIALTSLPIGLDTVRVTDQNVCRNFADSAAATYAVWEQIRTALIAAELTAASRTILATTVTYDRAMDPSGGRNARIIDQSSRVSTEYVTRAWRTLPPDSLRRVGYVVTGRDASVTYYAPGIEMLLSPLFVSDHCFRLVTDKKRRAFLGIAFEPTPERKKAVAEVRGTMWIDRASSELRELEFEYVNVSPEQEDRAGGDVSFARMRDGTWAVARWEIRMPVIDQVILPGQTPQPRVVQIQTTGGQLAFARRGTDTLWSGPRFPLRGTAVDSASGSPVRGARIVLTGTARDATTDERGRFTIDSVFAGNYTLDVHTASLDSMNAAHRVQVTLVDSTTPLELKVPTGTALAALVCGGRVPASGGIIVGTLRLRDTPSTAALRGGKVVAEWNAEPLDAASSRVRR